MNHLRLTTRHSGLTALMFCQTNPGQAKDLLLDAATLWQADMIVMGSSARSVWVRRILGDTLLDVLSQAEIPLFLAQ